MAATDANSVLMLHRAFLQCGQQAFHILDQDIGGAHQLNVQTCVQNIRRCHALMDKAGFFGAYVFRKVRQEGDDVVLGDGFDFVDAGHVEFDVLGFPDGISVFLRDHTKGSLCIAGVCLDLVPDFEFGFWGPDGHHFRTGITRDHCARPFPDLS